jgi:hypothetical protein
MKTPQNDGLEDTIQLDLSILPEDKQLQFRALAAKKAKKLVRKQFKSDTRKGPTRVAELLKKAAALDTALAQGEEARALWPDNLSECISILTAFSVCLAYSAENYLPEISPEEMDAIEMICRTRGISYEDAVQEALDAYRRKRNGETSEGDEQDDQDEEDWWKQAS